MLHNYINQVLKTHCSDDWKIIPFSGCPTRFHEIEFKGWRGVIFTQDNEVLNEMLGLASETVAIFINFYKEKYAFTEPQLGLPYDGKSFIINIGMMELEEYDRRYSTEKGDENE